MPKNEKGSVTSVAPIKTVAPTINVTRLQDAMIVGSLLGDAHLHRTRAATGCCRLRICHSVAQRQYVDWKHSVLLYPFCANTLTPHQTARPGEYQFYTTYSDTLSTYHSAWYIRGKGSSFLKRLPGNIGELLHDPIALAVWYLDDGTRRGDSQACRLASMGFSHGENLQLVECLGANFGLEAKVETIRPKRAGGPLYGLYLQSRGDGYRRLKSPIHPFVEAEIPSMLYKLQ